MLNKLILASVFALSASAFAQGGEQKPADAKATEMGKPAAEAPKAEAKAPKAEKKAGKKKEKHH